MTRSSLLVRVITAIGALAVAGALASADTRATQTTPNPVRQSTPQAAERASSAAQRLVGGWHLDSRTVTRADGAVLTDPVLGAQPLGRLYYDASGGMMLQMMRAGRTAAIGAPANSRDAANPRVVLGYDAYFGRYTVDERAGTITHRVEGSLFPEDLGKDFVRPFTLDGDALTLKFTSAAEGGGVTRTLVFRRAR
jgi:hypothetical protein